MFAMIAGATLVIACGPDFPPQLLDDRKGVLLATPSNGFDYEAGHLVPAGELKSVAPSASDAPQPGGRPQDRRTATAKDDSYRLAVAGLGEEARMYLDGPAGGTCSYKELVTNDPCTDAIAPADMKRAIRLYAAQAAHGSDSGVNSLGAIADWALGKPARVLALIDDPVALRLLVVYALDRLGGALDTQPDSAAAPRATPASGAASASDASASDASASDASGSDAATPDVAPAVTQGASVAGVAQTPASILATLGNALATLPAQQQDGVDRFAALAYHLGNYDLAARLAGRLETPLAWWVRAKLATRQGDTAAAATAYARAVQAFPQNAGSLAPWSQDLVRAEQGVLSLSRGQYVEALDQLYKASVGTRSDDPTRDALFNGGNYWGDLMYVAERVLTTDELRAYVDAHVPATPAPTDDVIHMDGAAQDAWFREHPAPASDRLRALLARRLMRDGARTQALPYFPADGDPRFTDGVWVDHDYVMQPSHTRQDAARYDSLLKRGHDAWRDTTRAQALYQAALLAREKGMDLIGYAEDPDYEFSDGFYTYGVGRTANAVSTTEADGRPDTPADRAARFLPGPYVTDGERRRYAASEARPYIRFHYRGVAADHAVAAADLLPPRSQAYAATLCRAARFVIDDDPDRAAAIYRRYIKEGALVPFGATFGRECPEPDFRGAARFPYVQAWRAVRRHPVAATLAAAAAAAALAAVVIGAMRLRRRRKTRPH